MSTENKVPVIRFKGFSGEWEETTIGNIGSFYYGKSAPKWSLEKNAQTRCVRYGELYTKFGASITKTYSRTNIDPKKLRFSSGGEILVPRVGEKPEDFGKCCCYLALGNIAIGEMISVFETTQNPLFYTYYFRNLYRVFARAVEGKNVKNLYYVELEPIAIYRTFLSEQTKIGQYFQQLDTLIEQHQQKHNKLLNLKKALLEKIFPKQGTSKPEIRFKGFSGAWEEKELGVDVADIIGGGTPSTSIKEYWEGNIDWYSPTEIGNKVFVSNSVKKITDLGLKKSSTVVLPANRTVLFTSRAGIGDMAILKRDGCTNQGFQSLVVKKGYDPYFIYSTGNIIKKYALKHASGSTFLEISGKQLGQMEIKIPCSSEQTKIGTLFNQLDTLINQHQSQLKKLNTIKQACLEKMFV